MKADTNFAIWKRVMALVAAMAAASICMHFVFGPYEEAPRRSRPAPACFDGHARRKSGNAVAFVTMVAGNQAGYLQGACALGKGIRRFWGGSGDYDAVALELSKNPLTDANRLSLKMCGWITCTVPYVEVHNEATQGHKLENCYSKLQAWNLTQYDRVVMLDADMLVVDDISPLASIPLEGNNSIAAVRDYWFGEFASGFNGGLLVLKPDAAMHARLLRSLKTATPHMIRYFEQSFLNDFFDGGWLELDGRWATNLAIYERDYMLWKAWEPEIKNVHYTVAKPWASVIGSINVYEIRQWWYQQRRLQNSAVADALYGAFGFIRQFYM